ncbi:hypothetical protein Tco_1174071 [Tanacetum coccineum]
MDQDFVHMVAASKIPMLKPGEFELWRMRIEQYIQMIDYALWEVIENRATLPKTTVMEGVKKVMPITSAEDKAQRRLEVKDRSTLMMGIPNEHQLKFNFIKDAKLLLEVIEKRFDGNAATKKTQRNLLKQQYENFTTPRSEMLDQTFDRLQKFVSQLELLDEKLSQEVVNQKLLRSLSPSGTHMLLCGGIKLILISPKWSATTATRGKHFSRECRAPRNRDNTNKESLRRVCDVQTSTSASLCHGDGLGGYDCSEQVREVAYYSLMAYHHLSSSTSESDRIMLDNVARKVQSYEKYNVVPPPYTGNFMPPTSDLSLNWFRMSFCYKPVVENIKSDEEV